MTKIRRGSDRRRAHRSMGEARRSEGRTGGSVGGSVSASPTPEELAWNKKVDEVFAARAEIYLEAESRAEAEAAAVAGDPSAEKHWLDIAAKAKSKDLDPSMVEQLTGKTLPITPDAPGGPSSRRSASTGGFAVDIIYPGLAAVVGLYGTRVVADTVSKIFPTAKSSKTASVLVTGAAAFMMYTSAKFYADRNIIIKKKYVPFVGIGAGLSVILAMLDIILPTQPAAFTLPPP